MTPPRLAREWRRPGGPWDVPSLDAALPATDVVDADVRLSPADVESRVAALAGGLRARGVRRGDAVAWQLPNWHESVLLYRACWRLGAAAVPVHHAAGEADLVAALSQVEPSLFLSAAHLGGVDRDGAVVVRGEGDGFAALLEDGARRAVAVGAARPADLAAVLFTSGSSGAPKAVLHTHRALAYKARTMVGVHGLRRDDVVLMPAPLAHVSGLLNGLLVPAAAGMTSVLMDRWDPDRAVRLVEGERVTFMVGPPTFFLGLMAAGPPKGLRLVSSGGAGVSPAFVDEATAALGCTVKRTYGSTEAPTVTTTYAGDPPERARATDGRPVGAAEVKVDATGELLVRGPELFAGYADPDQTRPVMARGGWYRTGDLARIDDGWVTIVGRLKDVIIRGGENIAAAELEAVLEAHPSVRQAVAVGEPDDRLGERVVAVVVADAPFDLEECRRWFGERGVTRFKWPERVLTVRHLPLLASGKPDRSAVRTLVGPTLVVSEG